MKRKLKAAVLFTGGKDSCLALLKSKEKYDVKFLLNVNVKNPDSYMFHKPDLGLLERQAEMLGIRLIVKESKGEKEKELGDLQKLLKLVDKEVDVVVVGGIASSYQGRRIKKICGELGLEVYAPLWDYDAEKIWKELLEKKFKVIITKISCEGLSRELIGRVIDKKRFSELKKLSEKYKFRLDFEGGEAETCVLWMPGMKKEIKIKYKIKSEETYRHLVKDIQMKNKK